MSCENYELSVTVRFNVWLHFPNTIGDHDVIGVCWSKATRSTWTKLVSELSLWSQGLMWCLYGWTSGLKHWTAHRMFGWRDLRPVELDKTLRRFTVVALVCILSFQFYWSERKTYFHSFPIPFLLWAILLLIFITCFCTCCLHLCCLCCV